MSDMENKALTTLQLVAKRLGIPEDKIEVIPNPNDDIHKAKIQDGKHLIYSWYVPEETFATVLITNTDTNVGCELGPYLETEDDLDRIISAIKEFIDTPEESVAYVTGQVYDSFFLEGMVTHIPRNNKEGVGSLVLGYSKVYPAKDKEIPINVYVVVTLTKLGKLEYEISYTDRYCITEIVMAEDYKSLCNTIASKIRAFFILSMLGLQETAERALACEKEERNHG